MDKLETLCEIEGYTNSDNFAEANIIDSVVPGICMNADCDYTVGVEPDCEDGWCEICGTGSVTSGLRLMGLV